MLLQVDPDPEVDNVRGVAGSMHDIMRQDFHKVKRETAHVGIQPT